MRGRGGHPDGALAERELQAQTADGNGRSTVIEQRAPTRFRYRARNAEGRRKRGVVEALSPRGARTALMEQGLDPTRIREKAGLNVQLRADRVKPVDLMHFSRQLAVFVTAGIPILEAIEGIAAGAKNGSLQKTLYDVNDALRAGQLLSEAFAEHPSVFPPFYLGAVQASERTGNLDAALARLADYLERSIETRRKMVSAFTYPGVVIAFAVVVVIVQTTFVMPRFQSFFEALGGQLPLPTRMLVGAMSFITSWWFLLAGGTAGITLGALVGVRTPRGRAWWHALLLKLPGLGELVSISIIERFCRALGSMVEAAVTIPEAMRIAGEGTNNEVFKTRIEQARDRMLEGQGIAAPIAATGLFPVTAIQMIDAGERTGTLEMQLLTAADFFDKELDYKLARYTALFEPAVILVAGLVVGFVAVALVSAMYGLITVVDT